MAAWVCFVIAVLNAACWSVATPFFQVDDEPDHFAYVQQLAETGTLPKPSANGEYSEEQQVAMGGLDYTPLRYEADAHALRYRSEQQSLEHELAAHPARRGSGDAGVANSEPPLFYALQTLPYLLGSSGSILVRMELMRLLSALMGGLTALFVFLFMRELVPGERWLWTVGGLCAAFAPLLGVISGSVNPEAMLTTVSAAGFYVLARGFRRGLTPRLAAAIGLVVAIGLLTKLNYIALLPGMLLGLAILVGRAARVSRVEALRSLALACAVGAGPVAVYLFAGLSTAKLGGEGASNALHGTGILSSPLSELSYIWQMYLPRLPGMSNDFPGAFVPREVWFNGIVGIYGWQNVVFSDSVYRLALVPAAAIVALCVGSLCVHHRVLRAHLMDLAVYAVMGVGVLLLLGATAHTAFPATALGYRSPRYLLPLLPLGCAAFAMAAFAVGRRWGPVVGVGLIFLVLADDVFSQLLVISHYYG